MSFRAFYGRTKKKKAKCRPPAEWKKGEGFSPLQGKEQPSAFLLMSGRGGGTFAFIRRTGGRAFSVRGKGGERVFRFLSKGQERDGVRRPGHEEKKGPFPRRLGRKERAEPKR